MKKTCVYQVRHGGASTDLVSGARPLLEVMSRGRWSTTTSLKRYAKAGKLQKIVNDLSVENLAYCEWAAHNVIAVLSGTVAARPPPSRGGSGEAYALPVVV